MRQKDQTKDKLLREITSLRGRISDLEESEKQREQLAREIALVDEISRIITSTLDIDQVYEQFAQEVKKLVDFDRVAISVFDNDTATSTIKYVAGLTQPGLIGKHQ